MQLVQTIEHHEQRTVAVLRELVFQRLHAGELPPSAGLAERIRKNVAAYGETITDLSDDTWRRSVSLWRRKYWDLLIDLWSVESGSCDPALIVHVLKSSDGFRFETDDVHVPLA